MDYGLCLPNFREGASREGMEAAAETADHILVAAKYADRVPVIRAAAEAAGRPMPWLTARAYTQFGPATDKYYAIRGTVDEMAAEVRAFEALGVSHVALWFDETDPARVSAVAERFAREVAPLV